MLVILLALIAPVASAQQASGPVYLNVSLVEEPNPFGTTLPYGNLNIQYDPWGPGWLDGPVLSVFDMAEADGFGTCATPPCARISTSVGTTFGDPTWSGPAASVFWAIDDAAHNYFDAHNNLPDTIARTLDDGDELVVVLQDDTVTTDWPCSASCMRPGDWLATDPDFDIVEPFLGVSPEPAAYDTRPKIFLHEAHHDEARIPVHEFAHHYHRVVLPAAGTGGGFPFGADAGFEDRVLDEALGYWYASDHLDELFLGRDDSSRSNPTSRWDPFAKWADEPDDHWLADVLTAALWNASEFGTCHPDTLTRGVFDLVDHHPPATFAGADPTGGGSTLRGFAAMLLAEIDNDCTDDGLREVAGWFAHHQLHRAAIDQADAGSSVDPGDRFGEVLHAADLDGDGFDDLVVASPREDDEGYVDNGVLHVLWGGPGGVVADFTAATSLDQSDGVGSSDEDGDQFGWAITSGDFDDDGIADLAVGSPYEDYTSTADTGLVQIWYGDGTRDLDRSRASALWQSTVGQTREAGDRFGFALAAADVTGDGIDDLIIGSPGEDADAGLVTVVPGVPGGVDAGGAVSFDQVSMAGTNPEPGDAFGHTLATGDLDGDGILDLVVGSPYEDWGSLTAAGVTHVVHGPITGAPTSSDHLLHPARTSHDWFGFALAVADFDGDGIDDLAVGSPDDDTTGVDAGRIDQFAGGSRNLPHAAFATDGVARDMVGHSLVAARRSTGEVDLVAGAPHADGVTSEEGMLHLYDDSNLTADHPLDGAWIWDDVGHDTRIGWALAAGDFDGDGSEEVAIGAPRAEVLGDDDAGAVIVRRLSLYLQ